MAVLCSALMVPSFYGCGNDGKDDVGGDACSDTEPCRDDRYRCVKGVCLMPVPENGDCSKDHVYCVAGECLGGVCRVEDIELISCEKKADCDAGYDCHEGKCRKPAGVGGSCSTADKYCAEGVCDEGICRADAKDGIPGGACTAQTRCPQGYACKDEKCQKGVDAGSPCGYDGLYCLEGTCVDGRCELGHPMDRYCANNPDDLRCKDTDGDTISDFYDRCDVDTDGDTVPDCMDLDSDGDTIPDAIEAGVRSHWTDAPADSDGDGVYDFLDLDSDSNGIPDAREGRRTLIDPETGVEIIVFIDTDGDTILDHVDPDNDGDGISDINEIFGLRAPGVPAGYFSGDCDGDGEYDLMGTPENPIDCDGDTVPDYMDLDSDGDGVLDVHEAMWIYGKFFARYSQDADGDTIPDSIEGVLDAFGKLRDTDGDGIPDLVDLDSDNDGLSDAYEMLIGTDPYNADTDGDGYSDLVEVGAGTDPLDPNDNPGTRGNFVFIVPYQEETTPKKETLSFATSIQTLDLYFSMDTTTSMREEKDALSSPTTGVKAIIDGLMCRDLGRHCIENIECADLSHAICSEKGRCITDPGFGEGCFADMWTGFGAWNDINTFRNVQSLQPDPQRVVNIIGTAQCSGTACTGDRWYGPGSAEAPTQAPACAVAGRAECTNTNTNCSTDTTKVGCAGFRKEAIKVYLQITDADDQCLTPAATCRRYCENDFKHTGDILYNNQVRFVGLWGTGDDAPNNTNTCGMTGAANSTRSIATGLGIASRTVKADGTPFIYEALDAAVSVKTREGVLELAKSMPLGITSDVEDIDKDASKLVEALVVNISGETVRERICTDVTARGIVTGQFEGISSILPGTSVCYDVIPVNKQSIFPATSEPQVLKARVKVMGDGSVLNSGIAYFVVPPYIPKQVN